MGLNISDAGLCYFQRCGAGFAILTSFEVKPDQKSSFLIPFVPESIRRWNVSSKNLLQNFPFVYVFIKNFR